MFTVEDSREWQRARAKAAAEQPAFETSARGLYRVKGSGGNRYAVTVRAEGQGIRIDCTCLAGAHDKPCYHGATAYAHYIAAAATPVTPQRDQRLGWVESDLHRITKLAGQMSGDYEIMEDIQRAVRAALRALGEYEVDLLPATVDMAA